MSHSATIEASRRRESFTHELLPALLVLAFSLAVLPVRPPLPIDETRYLEVFRESLEGSPLLLRLCGEPYAEKTPLLFWIGRSLTWFSVPFQLALRCVPAVASALTVWVAARLGRRHGLALVGWVQAGLLLPLLAGQMLLFDPLLSLALWAALEAWTRRRDVALAAWSSLALLAKGPVALLFLVPFLWSTRSLRGEGRSAAWRAALALAVALLPLAAWALAAATRGGPEFADALLWDRWAGRIGKGAHHSRSVLFYVPVALVGALPGTLLLFRRGARAAPEWVRRLAWSLGLVVLAFVLIRGKQAHYLVPAAPALALLIAWKLESEPQRLGALRAGVRTLLALLLVVCVAAMVWLPRNTSSLTASGRVLVAEGGSWLLLGSASVLALAGLAASFRRTLSARGLLALGCASTSACLLPVHRLAGELLHPRVLAEALGARPNAAIAYLGTAHHGLYALLGERDDLEKIDDEAELAAFCSGSAGSLLLIDSAARPVALPPQMVQIASDVVHRSEVEVWCVSRTPSTVHSRGSVPPSEPGAGSR